MKIRLAEIAGMVGGTVEGDETIEITGLAKIEEAGPGFLTFIANPKYEKFIQQTKASAVIVSKDFPAAGRTLLRCEDPYFAFMQLVSHFYGVAPSLIPGIHPTAVIGKGVKLGDGVAIAAHAVIGANCSIGAGAKIYPGVVLADEVTVGSDSILYANVCVREGCRIGDRVIIHMGAVVGSDGFGFAFHDGRFHKIPQIGIVIIEDDVEIGANTTIDRATLGATVIRRGAKLDNLVQVAHNVEIGEHTVMAAQCGISGSTKVGKYVRMGGQVGLAGHMAVGDGATIGAQSGLDKDVPAGEFYFGYPARPARMVMREMAALSRLPELLKRVRKLEETIESFTQKPEKKKRE